MNDKRFMDIPLILETPTKDPNTTYAKEIDLLYGLASGDSAEEKNHIVQ